MQTRCSIVTIIIPLYVICDRFFKDLKIYEKLDYPNFDLLIVCDKKVDLPKLKNVKINLLLTGHKKTGPAEKRDLAMKYVRGKFCAFIDDDAYPNPMWLKSAVRWFKNPDIVAVGGPGVTPPTDSFWQKIGGYIIESYLCSGGIQHRYYPGPFLRFVDDHPAYNLIVRTKTLKLVGGYGSTFYGGEDTLLCLKLIKYGYILYNPNSIVYHHRRSFPKAHLKQIKGVGIHRGYFFKKYPKTSRKIIYLLPTSLTLVLLIWIILIIYNPSIFSLPFILIFSILMTLAIYSVYSHNVSIGKATIAAFGIILTHITYGIYFVKGAFIRNLEA